MRPDERALTRITLAAGYLEEAASLYEHRFWRACVSSSQLAIENAIKAILALYGPVPNVHDPAYILERWIQQGVIPSDAADVASEIMALVSDIDLTALHIQADYGDEHENIAPWDMFDEENARDILNTAKKVVGIVSIFVRQRGTSQEDPNNK